MIPCSVRKKDFNKRFQEEKYHRLMRERQEATYVDSIRYRLEKTFQFFSISKKVKMLQNRFLLR